MKNGEQVATYAMEWHFVRHVRCHLCVLTEQLRCSVGHMAFDPTLTCLNMLIGWLESMVDRTCCDQSDSHNPI